MKFSLFLISLIIFLISCNPVNAQSSWTLVTPVKTSSVIKSVSMLNYSTGYALDQTERRILKTTDGGQTWARKYYYMTNQPNDMWMFDENHGIVCTITSSMYVTHDGFETYTSLPTPLGGMYSFYFTSPAIGYVSGSNGGIMKTLDSGATWTALNSTVTDLLFRIYFFNDTIGYACGNSGRIIKTTDAGLTWNTLNSGTTFRIYDVCFADLNNGIAVGIGGTIIKTNDGGITWNPASSPTTGTIFSIRKYGNDLVATSESGVVLHSLNFGNTWNLSTYGNKDVYTSQVNSFGIGLIGGDECLYYSKNNGSSWSLLQLGKPHSFLNKVSFADSIHGCSVGYATTGGINDAIIRTIDGGKNWITVSYTPGGSAGKLGVHILPDGSGAYGGSTGLNGHTTNYGQTFSNGTSPSVAVRAVWAFSSSAYLMGGGYINSGIYRTDDSGATWTYTAGGTIKDFYFPSHDIGYAVGDGGACMKTIDAGLSWTQLTTTSLSDFATVFFLDDTIGFIAGSNTGRKTTDGGVTWTQLNSPSFTSAIHFYTPDSGYAVMYSGDVVLTNDGGNSYNTVVPGLIDQGINDAAFVNGNIVAVGTSGDVFTVPLNCNTSITAPVIFQNGNTLYSSSSVGNQWYDQSGPIAGEINNSFTPTHSGDFYVITTNAIGCNSDVSNIIHVGFAGLETLNNLNSIRVYPNPSHDKIMIVFTDEFKGRNLQIFDVNGKIVQEMKDVSENVNLDIHQLDDGIYFLKSLTNENVLVVKFVKI